MNDVISEHHTHFTSQHDSTNIIKLDVKRLKFHFEEKLLSYELCKALPWLQSISWIMTCLIQIHICWQCWWWFLPERMILNIWFALFPYSISISTSSSFSSPFHLRLNFSPYNSSFVASRLPRSLSLSLIQIYTQESPRPHNKRENYNDENKEGRKVAAKNKRN